MIEYQEQYIITLEAEKNASNEDLQKLIYKYLYECENNETAKKLLIEINNTLVYLRSLIRDIKNNDI